MFRKLTTYVVCTFIVHYLVFVEGQDLITEGQVYGLLYEEGRKF